MKILITGASGHLGTALLEQLYERGHSLYTTFSSETGEQKLNSFSGKIKTIHFDLNNPHKSTNEMQNANPDLVYHLAWNGVTAAHRNNVAQLTQNISGTLVLFQILKECSNLKQIIALGSQAEYGLSTDIYTEKTKCNPKTLYGKAKYELSRLLQICSKEENISFAWVRLLAIYGPNDTLEHFIPSFIMKLLHHEIPETTKGEQQVDYLYEADAANALVNIGEEQATGVYNLSSGNACTLREIMETIKNNIDSSIHIPYGTIPYRKDQVMQMQADISKLQSSINWHPSTTLKEGIAKTIHHLKQQL